MGLAAACILSYLLGAVPNGLLFGRLLWHTDLRRYGSHNIGATNAWRTLGRFPGTLIFFLDFLKGAIGVCLGSFLDGSNTAMVLAGLCTIIGHSWPIYLGFRGGKGVATGLGVIAMLMPAVTVFVFLVWLLIVVLTRYVSLGSVVAAALVPLAALLTGAPAVYVWFSLLAAMFVIVRHRENIKRLRAGTENRIKSGHR